MGLPRKSYHILFLFSLLFSPSSYSASTSTPNVDVEPFRQLINDTVQVPAGRHVGYALPLEQGAQLVAQFHVSGGLNQKVNVLLLNDDNYRLFASRRPYQFYNGTTGAVRQIGHYSFNIPQTNNYDLVIDNSGALLMSRHVGLYVYEVFRSATPESQKSAEDLQKVYDGLKQFLIFNDFKIHVRHCGIENAFSNPDITLCAELDDSLAKSGLRMAMPFVFFHEVGHSMLRVWGYPLYDNEDVADEFSTVMWLMLKAPGPALAAAKYFSNQTSENEALSKIWVDDRHTVSPQRARNIAHWLNEPNELLARWQKILIPNMQTAALRAMDGSREPWVDHKLIQTQLATRH